MKFSFNHSRTTITATVVLAIVVTVLIIYSVRIYVASVSLDQYTAVELIPKAVHLGTMPEDSVANFSVRLRNVSGETIGIKSIGTSCGCTRAETTASKIIPDKSILINGRLRAEMPPGHYSRTVFINFDRPYSKVYIPVDVDVYSREFALSKGYIDFGNIKLGASRSESVFLTGTKAGCLLNPHTISCPNWLHTSWLKIGENSWKGLLRAKPNSTVGTFNNEVRVDPGITGSRPLSISVKLNVVGVFECKPSMLNLLV